MKWSTGETRTQCPLGLLIERWKLSAPDDLNGNMTNFSRSSARIGHARLHADESRVR